MACFIFQKRPGTNYNLTPQQIRPMWDFLKENFFDQGKGFAEAINGAIAMTGHNDHRFWAEVMAGPKTAPRVKTNAIYAAESARNAAKQHAALAIKTADMPAGFRYARMVGEIPRQALVAIHGAVFPVTHGGGLILNPGEWSNFAKGWWTSMKVGDPRPAYDAQGKRMISPTGYKMRMGDVAHEEMKTAMVTHAKYGDARAAGVKINPEEGPQGILTSWLTSRPGWSRKAWLGLQVMRFNVWLSDMAPFYEQLNQGTISKGDFKAIAESMAEVANHATGVTNWQLGIAGKAAFAPQLTWSKVMRAVVDPAKTLATFAKMSSRIPVSPAERMVAYKRLGNATQFLGTTVAALTLNQALLSALGSKQKINFTDPMKADWMRFKTGEGHVFATRGPEEILRLMGHLTAIGYAGKKELKGESQREAALDAVAKFLQYKISPGIGQVGEFFYGKDVFGRPLPEPIQKARSAIGLMPQEPTKTKPQYTTLEYALQKGPIFIGGGARDVYNSMVERGMSVPDATALFRASLVSAGEFFGFGGYEESPTQEKPISPQQRIKQRNRELLKRLNRRNLEE
jgi:hypothetical protein